VESVEQIKARLQEVFRDVFDDASIQLFREMTAKDIEDWDSLTHINLVVASEKEFAVKFNLAEIKALKNVGEFIDLIERKLGEKK
jgi:acyl carrier protein